MRFTILVALITLSLSSAAAASEPAAIYSSDPNHLWNRLYRAMAIRTLDGVQYGADISEAYPDDFDNNAKLIATLDEFLSSRGEPGTRSDVARALLLNDVWTAFDISTRSADSELHSSLARAIDRLRMSVAALSGLPDNYAAAVQSGRFAADFDPAKPATVFLPPDLFDSAGPWVQIGESGLGLVAPTHVGMSGGRSAFFVFIRCPGGREATVSYLKRLNLHPTPWQLHPSSTAIRYPSREQVRQNVLQADPNTPQFPEGTVVALVRRMLVIDEGLRPAVTPITQKVQFRVYRKLHPATHEPPQVFKQTQSAYEFVMRRKELIAGVAGGLHPVMADEKEFQALLLPMKQGDSAYFTGPVVLDTCATCHSSTGIFSVRSYLSGFEQKMNPQLLPANRPEYQAAAAVDWKLNTFTWGMLRGLLSAGQTR